jgi:hypothetical protein
MGEGIRWTPDIPEPGIYNVYALPSEEAACPQGSSLYVIHRYGRHRIELDKLPHGSEKQILIGTYYFDEGVSGGVELAGQLPSQSFREFVFASVSEHNPLEEMLFRDIHTVHSTWGALCNYALPRDPIGTEEPPGIFSRSCGSIGALTNAEFSTYPFIMPSEPLRINIDVMHGTAALTQGSYCKVAVYDICGAAIPGYEKDKSLFGDVNATDYKLNWYGSDTSRLAGRKVFLRFYIRKARLYAIHTSKQRYAYLSNLELTIGRHLLEPWENTKIQLRGRSEDGRLSPLQKKTIFYEVSDPGLVQVKGDKLDVHEGYVTVIREVATPVTVTLTACLSLGGRTIRSNAIAIEIQPLSRHSGTSEYKMLFMQKSDLHDGQGILRFKANMLEYYADTEGLPTTPRSMVVFNRKIGNDYHVWGDSREGDVYRAVTRDGIRYANKASVTSSMRSDDILTMAYNLLHDKYIVGERGLRPHRWYTHHSTDGGDSFDFQGLAFYGHDALHVKWLDETEKYIGYHLESVPDPKRKRYPDNIGLVVRKFLKWTSPDGMNWSLEGSLLEPDELDAPEVELYWMNAFRYADRYIGMLMIYAASPEDVMVQFPYGPFPSKHGPHVKVEWIVSKDGEHWERLYRGEEERATKDVRIFFFHDPMILHDKMLFLISNQSYIYQQIYEGDRVAGALPGQNLELYTLPLDRIAGITGEVDASFSTLPFEMPAKPLHINMDGVIEIEIMDRTGACMPGYEKVFCRIEADDLHHKLVWGDKDTTSLAGQTVSLRFHFFQQSIVYSRHDYSDAPA